MLAFNFPVAFHSVWQKVEFFRRDVQGRGVIVRMVRLALLSVSYIGLMRKPGAFFGTFNNLEHV